MYSQHFRRSLRSGISASSRQNLRGEIRSEGIEREQGCEHVGSSLLQEIAKSGSLKVVLGTLLSLGNYMNGGHPKRGQADGFQIDALSKVCLLLSLLVLYMISTAFL